MYIELGQAPAMYEEERCANPEGLKISRKQSMFAAETLQFARKVSFSKLGGIDAAGKDTVMTADNLDIDANENYKKLCTIELDTEEHMGEQ